MIKKLPLPISGLMLACAAAGNLVGSYGSLYKSLFGVIAALILVKLLIKAVMMPNSIKEGFDNPVVASVMPTFSMGIMLLSTYIKPYASSAAIFIWLAGLILHCLLIVLFSIKYIGSFNIKKIFPSYFIVYVGIVCASVTAPAFNMAQLGQYIFWFGLATYIILLPIVIYRVLSIKELPEPAMPTLAIFTAPASLCLAGYLNSFQSKSPAMIGFLSVLSLLMFVSVIIAMPKLLKLKFYPSYSAFTFPFVITAIAMKGTNAYLMNIGNGIALLRYLVYILELWAVIMVIYVLVRYMIFMFSNTEAAKGTPAVKA
ncbi:TDT family transporter [Lutispora sp.]|uniref:TDT family transporter n=1 Tax=Lutispora sp. TaxID=2828727 RepID=UPI0035667451